LDDVVAGTAAQDVVAGAAAHDVVARAAVDAVVAGLPEEDASTPAPMTSSSSSPPRHVTGGAYLVPSIRARCACPSASGAARMTRAIRQRAHGLAAMIGGGSPVHVVADAAAFGLVEIYPEALRLATSESGRDLPATAP
jgi:hypothetical protein